MDPAYGLFILAFVLGVVGVWKAHGLSRDLKRKLEELGVPTKRSRPAGRERGRRSARQREKPSP